MIVYQVIQLKDNSREFFPESFDIQRFIGDYNYRVEELTINLPTNPSPFLACNLLNRKGFVIAHKTLQKGEI